MFWTAWTLVWALPREILGWLQQLASQLDRTLPLISSRTKSPVQRPPCLAESWPTAGTRPLDRLDGSACFGPPADGP
ncbi:MAG: hypothetical protein NZ602_02010 [Thermoguttaceae bacterium]|nr:hypothetical protein [Thermoguttaceae bacterium]MDW8038705.1 hypothetical protein [Thermoguttaceae bacterium]